MAIVLERLRQVPENAEARVQHLQNDLLPALESIVPRMEAQSLDATSLAELRDDFLRLQFPADTPAVSELWNRALRVLADFTGESQPRRSFWKRPR
ncbi:hypothetical protein LUW74_39940 [Actinomadura madurae]|nr:hypothetical protein [Actinomadura madurae]URN08929.1 hypothetical protein LUW74_39940 [Actinomadura madurae]